MNGKSEAEMHQMIGVSEEYRQKMFDECKRHFYRKMAWRMEIPQKRSEVFRAYQLSVKEGDRLKGHSHCSSMKSSNTLLTRKKLGGVYL